MNDVMSTITAEEEREAEQANESGRTPVVFVHGLWLLPSSWDRWAELFEHAGYASLTPGWPDDPDTVEEAREHPEVLAGKSIGEIADHFEAVIGKLDKKPVIIGHSTGALLTESWPVAGWRRLRSRSALHRAAESSRCRSRLFASRQRPCATRRTSIAPSH